MKKCLSLRIEYTVDRDTGECIARARHGRFAGEFVRRKERAGGLYAAIGEIVSNTLTTSALSVRITSVEEID